MRRLTPIVLILLAPMCVLAQDDASSGNEADRAAIEKAAVVFVNAYNKHDAKAVTALFAEDAEIVERSGERFVGREEIQAAFTAIFKASPQAKISVSMDSLRFVTPNVAVEEGATTFFPDGETATVDSTYRVAHVKRDGKWRMAGVRSIDDTVLTNYEYLRDLEWMIGHWIDEDSESLIETRIRWAPNRAFLLRDFTVKTGGETVLTGTQRIGWDSRNKQFRSWLFDSEGGYVEGLWTSVGDGYVVRSSGYLRDGTAVSGTTRMDRVGGDRMDWSMFNRLRGDEVMPDVEVTMVRKPPEPVAAAKSE